MLARIKHKIDRVLKERAVNKLVKDVARNSTPIKEVPYKEGHPVVLCLLKNGSYFIESFMKHYRDLGFVNFYFIDNGSDDGSVEQLCEYPVTVLQCTLPYKTYKWAFKQYLVKQYGAHIWSLYVDIDELWDYPYSDRIALPGFIKYLNAHKYTAVQSHMLDMFADLPIAELKTLGNTPLKEAYPFYDNSGLIAKPYRKAYNAVNHPEMRHYFGGVNNSAFGISEIYISKLPMIKWNKSISVHETSHTSTHVNIADVSTILLHYRFVFGFYEKACDIIEKGSYWNASGVYQKYIDLIEEDAGLNLHSEHAVRYENPEQLLKEGMLVAGQPFMNLVRKHQ